ncbi:MAG: carbohydrate ABC transporter permease [Clostridiales bacterium]|nr:carbohydrate ABC transporter permease [Clostridiales bacterium]
MIRKVSKAGYIFRYTLFGFMFLFLCFPLYWTISTSFRDTAEIQKTSVSIIQKTFTFDHYIEALTGVNLLTSMKNSLLVTLITVTVTIIVGFLMGYAFSKLFFKGKRMINTMILLTQFIPMVAYIIPLYLIMSQLKLLNTLWCLLITYIGTSFPMAVVLLTNYIQDVPTSLEEAAKIDGCNAFQAMFKIIFPLAKPGIISTAIFAFVSVWQEYLVAVSFITKDEYKTVSVALKSFVHNHGTDWGGLMAGAVIISIPVVVLFMFCKEGFADNIAGGVKG